MFATSTSFVLMDEHYIPDNHPPPSSELDGLMFTLPSNPTRWFIISKDGTIFEMDDSNLDEVETSTENA